MSGDTMFKIGFVAGVVWLLVIEVCLAVMYR